MQNHWRPKFHFSPDHGWINDPNGLVRCKDEYHMFYQYYGEDTVWGPMHWGHVRSKDLLHWEQLPVALCPDELGYIFSGSCYYDEKNVSGLGSAENPPLLAFYTSHLKETKQEQQSLAYSTDGIHFTKYPGNPIIPGPEYSNRRDPEVLENPILGGYTMVVTEETQIAFYHSADLLHWERSGTFAPGEYGLSGICECPCLFPAETEEGRKWVLMISMILSEAERSKAPSVYNKSSHITQYFVGDFDGEKFVDTECSREPLVPDYGMDLYAPVCFSGVKDVISIGWVGNWEYSDKIPTAEEGYRGAVTLPRRLFLKKTGDGYRLRAEILTGEETPIMKIREVYPGDGKTMMIEPREAVAELRTDLPAEGEILLTNGREEARLAFTEQEYIFDRSRAGRKDFSESFAEPRHSIFTIPRRVPAEDREHSKLHLIWDRSVLEVSLDDGLTMLTAYLFPEEGYERVEVRCLRV